MRLEAFDFDLPARLVAQRPPERREAARLMVLSRAASGAGPATGEETFDRIPELLKPGDLVVVNDTRVLPARVDARKPTGGRVELLLLDPQSGQPGSAGPGSIAWRCLLSTSKGIHPGTCLQIGDDLEARLDEEPEGGRARVSFRVAPGAAPVVAPEAASGAAPAAEGEDLTARLFRRGRMPLPPYIRREPLDRFDALDRERYQTVYAEHDGAIAAPTAGLHFTPAILERLEERGIGVARLTLHVGAGTFQPVRVAQIEEHRVEPERFRLPAETVAAIDACRKRGGRVVAVGTTVTRVLEASALGDGLPRAGEGWCDLVILPGHRFRVVEALITNLHLPRSSLLILVAAFAGRERILEAYREAVARGFRFYSYGDAMLIQ